jgi:endonuclease/exonuclease/phosphatase (EEP) superfamily protein YafD
LHKSGCSLLPWFQFGQQYANKLFRRTSSHLPAKKISEALGVQSTALNRLLSNLAQNAQMNFDDFELKYRSKYTI